MSYVQDIRSRNEMKQGWFCLRISEIIITKNPHIQVRRSSQMHTTYLNNLIKEWNNNNELCVLCQFIASRLQNWFNVYLCLIMHVTCCCFSAVWWPKRASLTWLRELRYEHNHKAGMLNTDNSAERDWTEAELLLQPRNVHLLQQLSVSTDTEIPLVVTSHVREKPQTAVWHWRLLPLRRSA